MSRSGRPTAPNAGNLKPAPLALTAALVAKLAGDRPPFGKGVVHLLIQGSVCGCTACRPDDDIDWMGGGLLF